MNDYPEQNYRIEASQPLLFGGEGHAPTELDLRPDRPDYATADGIEARIERKHQKTRFLDCRGSQVGPVHRNLAPAIVWARAQGWLAENPEGQLTAVAGELGCYAWYETDPQAIRERLLRGLAIWQE